MIRKAKKKPVVIEFIQFNGNSNRDEICEWIGKNLRTEIFSDSAYEVGMGAPYFSIFIPTLEGEMRADPFDYIIKGVNGEFYPCKPDIFQKTYDTDEEKAKDYAITRTYPKMEQKFYDNLSKAKAIIKDLMNNSDEYARQRALDFLKKGENKK